jgi:hypothetical protein
MKQLLDAIQNNKDVASSDTILKEETTAKYLLMSTENLSTIKIKRSLAVCLSSRMFRK